MEEIKMVLASEGAWNSKGVLVISFDSTSEILVERERGFFL
jgi:hypothetical protein